MIMGSYPGIVSNSKISLDFGNPLEKQTLSNAAVYPAVMGPLPYRALVGNTESSNI